MVTETRKIDAGLLNRIGRNVHRGRNALQDGWERAEAGDMVRARKLLSDANEAIQDVHCALLAEGVENLDGVPNLSLDVPLRLLSSDTARRFLAAVAEAQRLAHEVDAERGHVLPSGEGCGWADPLDDLFYQVQAEVEGPKGKD